MRSGGETRRARVQQRGKVQRASQRLRPGFRDIAGTEGGGEGESENVVMWDEVRSRSMRSCIGCKLEIQRNVRPSLGHGGVS